MRLRAWVLLGINLVLLAGQNGFGKQAAIDQRGVDILLFWTNPHYFLALGCLGIQAVLWPLVLTCCPLGFAYASTSLNLVTTLLIAAIVFGESVTWSNLVGGMLIAIGTWIWSTSYQTAAKS